jgi:hypothetical protein
MNIQTINGIGTLKNPTKGEVAAHNTQRVMPLMIAGRSAAQLMIINNVLGWGTVLYHYKSKNPEKWEQIKFKWYLMGGNPDNLPSYINNGNQKSIRQVAPAILNRVSAIKKVIDLAYKIKAGGMNGLKKYAGLGRIGIYGEPVSDLAMILAALPVLLEIMQFFKGDVTASPDVVIPETPQEDEPSKINPLFIVGGLAVAGYFILPMLKEKG